MKTSRLLLIVCAIFAMGHAVANGLNYTIQNLNKSAHISGPTLTEEDFANKLVLIEIWGKDCPPCRASLPKMADLARKYAKDKRVLILGSHQQGRADDAIRKLLKQNKCDYPVYQFLTTSLEPASRGIPHVYIINHKGELAWNGHPNAMAPVLEKLVKETPFHDPNSIIGNVNLEAFKSYASNFRYGKNIERAIQQVEARKERDPEVAEEADAIIAACYGWADAIHEEITTNLECYPSKAFIAYQKLSKSFPQKAAEFKPQFAEITKDKITGHLVKLRQEYAKRKTQPMATSSEKKRLASSLRMHLTRIDDIVKHMGEDVTEDALDVQKEWHALRDKLAE